MYNRLIRWVYRVAPWAYKFYMKRGRIEDQNILLPCPFCGVTPKLDSTGILAFDPNSDKEILVTTYLVECENDDCIQPSSRDPEAIRAVDHWNTRNGKVVNV